MAKNYDNLAKTIIQDVGGKDNVSLGAEPRGDFLAVYDAIRTRDTPFDEIEVGVVQEGGGQDMPFGQM